MQAVVNDVEKRSRVFLLAPLMGLALQAVVNDVEKRSRVFLLAPPMGLALQAVASDVEKRFRVFLSCIKSDMAACLVVWFTDKLTTLG
ncbi:hypothetical protein [Brenneria roseae]|uniref:hypothetical protein n=1 Tax=Brenneria roseae TaxID=1509241 RepID=UPI0011B1F1EB|nr:hypothetical protein [Brenneria roseae]